MSVLVLFLALLVSCPPGPRGESSVSHGRSATDSATVHVHVDAAENDEGRVVAALYASEDGFPRDIEKAAYTASAPIETDSAFVQVTGVSHGEYAVFVFHDADGSGTLNTNWVGMPTEGIALTNWTGGRPDFEDSTVEVGPDTTVVDLSFYYR